MSVRPFRRLTVRHAKPARPRPLTAALAATAVLTAVAVPALTTATVRPAAAATFAPAIDLANPTATVTDPIGALSPVNTECAAGQVDLNSATAAQLGAALNLPSDPTVSRLIALRPWLKGTDLSSVPGIGPDTAVTLAPKTCATQPTLPVATPRVCSATSQVDLQSATAATLNSALKLPMTTAQALVAARPLSQNLSQVIAPRVPGLSQPTVNSLLANLRICVTPAPMLAGGSAWRWATPAGGAVVTRDGFSLIVPPGRVTDPAGAYASVTPLPATDGLLPTMDAHIWGNWNSGSSAVAVRGPWKGTDQVAPVVLHDSVDRGLTVSSGDGVNVSTVAGRPTVTALQYSLSVTTIGSSPCVPNTAGYSAGPNLLCIKAITDGSLHDQWLASATNFAHGAAATITQQPSCQTITGPIAVAASLGQLPFGLACQTDSPDSTGGASWDITNNASGSVLGGLAKLGVLYDDHIHGGTSNSYVDGNSEDDIVLHLIEKALTNHSSILFPDQTLHLFKPVASGETYVDTNANAGTTAAWAGMIDVATLVPGENKLWKAWQLADPAGAEEFLSHCYHLDIDGVACVRDAIGRAVDAVRARPDLLTPDQSLVFDTLKKALVALTVGDWLTNFAAAVGISATPGQGVLFRNDVVPAPPSGSSGTGSGGSGAGSGGGTPESYIARDPSSHRSVLVTPTGTVLDIPDGGTFTCLAATWLVRDYPSQQPLNVRPTGTATCSDAGPRTWDFTPVSQGGNVPDGVLLREYFKDATSGYIASWLINSSGAIQTIRDGGTYECLAYTNPVVWDVPFSKIQAWTPVGTSDASCG